VQIGHIFLDNLNWGI